MEKDKKEKAIVEPKNIKDVGKNVLDRFNYVKCKRVGF